MTCIRDAHRLAQLSALPRRQAHPSTILLEHTTLLGRQMLASTLNSNYASRMLRLLLIIVLLMQPLLAQAAVADTASMPLPPTHSSAKACAGMHQMAQQDQTDPCTQQSPCSYCVIAGHCSSSAVGLVARAAGIDFPPPSVTPARTTDMLAIGHRIPPYRPPSATA